jgi:hypothetical protein
MNAEEMMAMNEIHQRADEVRAGLLAKVPEPRKMMDAYRPMHFDTLHNGDKEFSIEVQKSQCFEVANFRHAIMLGVAPTKINYDRELEFHKLIKLEKGSNGKGKSVLTSDAPIEIFSQWIEFRKAKGNVLVGGLGLGMAATMLLDMPGVTGVTVVEKEPKIIKLVDPQIDKRINIVEADLYQYLRQLPGCNPYEFAYHDIWYRTGEGAWAEDVVPLYRLTRKAGIKHMGAWGEHEMKWQLASALYCRSCLEEKYSSWKPYAVFVAGLKKALGGAPPYGPERKDEVTKLIKLYLNKIGTPAWEKAFNWDAIAEPKEEAA